MLICRKKSFYFKICHIDKFILSTSFTQSARPWGMWRTARHARPQGACLPSAPSMVLRALPGFWAGFSSPPLLRRYPHPLLTAPLERSPCTHRFISDPHT